MSHASTPEPGGGQRTPSQIGGRELLLSALQIGRKRNLGIFALAIRTYLALCLLIVAWTMVRARSERTS